MWKVESTMTKQCSSCGGFCGKVCQRTSANRCEPERDGKAELTEEVQRLSEENGDILKAIDRARYLLRRCETEMRYAGWSRHTADNPQHKELYRDVDEFIGGMKHWPMVGNATNNKGG